MELERNQMKEIEAKILDWCRKQEGVIGMRNAPKNPMPGREWKFQYRVINLGSWAFDPKRDVLFEADSWEEIWEQING